MDVKQQLAQAMQDAKPALIEFYSGKCERCSKMVPIIDELRAKMGDRANIIQIDADEYPAIAEEYKAKHFPAWFVYKDGTEFWHDNGDKPLSELADMLSRVI